MKIALLAASIVSALTFAAWAETCYTNCYYVGDVQYCTTTCNPY